MPPDYALSGYTPSEYDVLGCRPLNKLGWGAILGFSGGSSDHSLQDSIIARGGVHEDRVGAGINESPSDSSMLCFDSVAGCAAVPSFGARLPLAVATVALVAATSSVRCETRSSSARSSAVQGS